MKLVVVELNKAELKCAVTVAQYNPNPIAPISTAITHIQANHKGITQNSRSRKIIAGVQLYPTVTRPNP